MPPAMRRQCLLCPWRPLLLLLLLLLLLCLLLLLWLLPWLLLLWLLPRVQHKAPCVRRAAQVGVRVRPPPHQ